MTGKNVDRVQAKVTSRMSVENLAHQTTILDFCNVGNLIGEYAKHLANMGPGMSYYEIREAGDFCESIGERMLALSKTFRARCDTISVFEDDEKKDKVKSNKASDKKDEKEDED